MLLLLMAFETVAIGDLTYQVVGTNRTWQGTVQLDDPILVASGVVLRIAPGTRLQVTNPEAMIRVEGTIQMAGTEQQPILIDSVADWRGIELFQTDSVSQFYHVQFTAAKVALSSSISQLEIRRSRFVDCESALKLYRQSAAKISQSEFRGNKTAIEVETRSQLTLTQNRFLTNGTAVVASHNSFGNFNENHFRGNRQAIRLKHLFPGAITNNDFEKNDTGIICDQTMTSPLVEGNRFVANQKGIVSLLASKPQLKNNQFRNNQIALENNQLGSPQVNGNLFQGNRLAIKNERRSAPQVKQNHFENNQLALLCDYLSYPLVKQNNFVDNHLAVKLGNHQSADMDRQGVLAGQVEKAIADSGRLGKMAVFPPTNGVVDVTENWWGKELAAEPDIFFDRQKEKWVLDDTTGERYLRDQIKFSPWLQQ